MASFTAGTTFQDNVAGDVTAAKLAALVNAATPTSGLIQDRTAETTIAADDTLLFGDFSDSDNLKRMTVANFAGTLPTATITSGTITTLNSTTGTITTGVIPTLTSTTLITTGTGTAAAPAIVPTGDTNTGIFFPAADTIAFSEGGAEAMRIDSSGQVGIGTTSPAAQLDVSANARVGQGQITADTTVGNLGIYGGLASGTTNAQLSFFGKSVSNTGLTYEIGRISGLSAGPYSLDGGIQFSTASNNGSNVLTLAERLRINAIGSLLIGTSSETTGLVKLKLSDGTIDSVYGYKTGGVEYAGTFTNHPYSILTNNTEALRIDSSGNLLVGTTTDADHKICINHSHPASGSGGITINQIEAGTGRAIQFVFQTINQVGSITTTNSATAYNTSSDYRLKTNLEPISNGIERVKQLSVYRFNWIADQSGNKVDGFVAHEAQAIIPECVTGEKDAVDADGKPIHQGIDQSKIVPLLTAALKEAIAKIETLESKVTALEAA